MTTPIAQQTTDSSPPSAKDTSNLRLLLTIGCDIVAPAALYYVFRGAGLGEVTSLLLSGSAPAFNTLYSAVKHRRIDGIGIFTLAILTISALGTMITGSPRIALARNGVFTGLAALWLLVTLLAAKPFVYQALKSLLPSREEKLAQLWDTEPSVRRVLRGLTAMWGVGLMVDAALRVVMAYTLAVDTVPVLDGALYAVTWITLQVITQITLYRSGTLRLIIPRGPRPASA